MIVTHADMVACGYCNRGARAFCERHGINWQMFVQHGIDTKEIEHIDDAMLQRVVDYATQRTQGAQ